ncbi:MAG: histidine phosphatase family protein [Jatrophihabitantaceae bacterium]
MSDVVAEAGSAAEPASAVPGPFPEDAQLWLVRHGETEWSRSGQHTGRTDIALTPTGEQQARALRPMLTAVRPALVLCSPRRRARDTAHLAGLHDVTIDDDLAEWDYGDYEGRTTAQIRETFPGWTLFRDGVKNGESIEQVAARADAVITRALATLGTGPVVLFAHGHISRILGARWIGLPPTAGANLDLGTAAPSVLSVKHDAPVIERWNMPNPAAPEGQLP